VLHSIHRARERLGITLSEQIVLSHGLVITFANSKLLGRGGGKRELHEIKSAGRVYYAVWDPEIRRVVTYFASVAGWRGSLNSAGKAALAREHLVRTTNRKLFCCQHATSPLSLYGGLFHRGVPRLTWNGHRDEGARPEAVTA